jgi:oxygen-independent coproporphyrinogen-3 oxidase
MTPQAAYLHIPFCAHHCGYCDFAVSAGQDHLIDLYLEAITLELEKLEYPRPVQTIFLGGGTPTYLNVRQLERLLSAIRKWLLLPDSPQGEFSIESTPDSIDPEKIAVLSEFDVNRISIGVQTFHAHLLPVLDRIHSPEQAAPAIEMARKRIPRISLDLIFGIPAQSIADWQADLERAVTLGTDHLSTYGLTYEKGTPLWKDRQRGKVQSLDEELEREMYLLAIDHLSVSGFEHYEISNFAKPDCRCRHNEVYWANHAYYGFGVGAARYVDGKRELNVRNTNEYIRKVLSGESPTFQSERLEGEERARETIAIQLRRCDGIDRAAYRVQTGFDLDELVGEKIGQYVGLGLLDDRGQGIRLTREGKCLADAIVAGLL